MTSWAATVAMAVMAGMVIFPAAGAAPAAALMLTKIAREAVAAVVEEAAAAYYDEADISPGKALAAMEDRKIHV